MKVHAKVKMQSGAAKGRWVRVLRGFTLIELLLAVAIFSVVLLAINTVFFSALRLQNAVTRRLDQTVPVQQVLGVLRRDLQMTLPPSGMLASDFRVGAVTTTSGTAQGTGIEFYTSSGRPSDEYPWGDVQKVIYQLRDSAGGDRSAGRELYRSVTRNLLSTLGELPEEQWLLGNVESMEFECYSGTDWRTAWDTSLTETNLPVAVRIRLMMVPEKGTYTPRDRMPYELLVPLMVQYSSFQQTSATTSTEGGE
jgi:general secretion pathway protein J